jgi:hypothetical protein
VFYGTGGGLWSDGDLRGSLSLRLCRTAKWRTCGDSVLSACQPQFISAPRQPVYGRVAICDVTSATNTRTVHATLVPSTWPCGNTAAVLRFESAELALAAVGVLNSMVFDWFVRRRVSGLHLNKFYLADLVWPRLTRDALTRAAKILCAQNPRYTDAGLILDEADAVAGRAPRRKSSSLRTVSSKLRSPEVTSMQRILPRFTTDRIRTVAASRCFTLSLRQCGQGHGRVRSACEPVHGGSGPNSSLAWRHLRREGLGRKPFASALLPPLKTKAKSPPMTAGF